MNVERIYRFHINNFNYNIEQKEQLFINLAIRDLNKQYLSDRQHRQKEYFQKKQSLDNECIEIKIREIILFCWKMVEIVGLITI